MFIRKGVFSFMGRRSNFSKEEKLRIVKAYLTGEISVKKKAFDLGIGPTTIRNWISNYEAMGEQAFDDKPRNKTYTKQFKEKVIKAYLNGEGSYEDIAKKYKITASLMIRKWVIKYNRHNEIKTYNPKGYVYMAKTRKVSYEEKIEIIKWTITHNDAYKLAAEKYETSYAQVYNWVKKYRQDGEEGLLDARGKRKAIESLSEVEKLQREIKLLKQKNERLEMEAEVIKKYQANERRATSTKFAKKPNTKR